MKKISIKEVRKIQLDMLQFIDNFCREHEIEYSLIGGSLLGSIRHGGFIPWDDDIDVMLRRDEYDRFIKLLNDSESKMGHLKLWHYSTRPTYHLFSKMYDDRTTVGKNTDYIWEGTGIFIDIFPYDALPASEEKRIKFMNDINKKAKILSYTSAPAYFSGSKWYYSLARIFLNFPQFIKFHGRNQELTKKFDKDSQKYFDDKSATQMGFLCSRYLKKEHFPRTIFDEYEDVSFEGMSVRKIRDHETYLRGVYGDYMKLPAEKDRQIHELYVWYWKNE
ncbi:LicD family protein [Lactococcus lactis]|uniref:LicD family protein n=1 Tax=Lactococcus lactis TaxID=1358 RepID=UPI0025A167B1|nr:LicD family protein [Lactococcus lactis]MDM7655599.1 LicD family protein [Lactococcus lactis]